MRLAGNARKWAIVCALGSFAPVTAGATVVEWLAVQHGVDPRLFHSAPSARLLGMGNLDLVILDEANELNAHDFAGNVAGVLEDGEGWVVESWLGNHLNVFDTGGLSIEDHLGTSGMQATYRKNGSRSLGAEVAWNYLETTNHPGDWSRVRGPLVSGIVNQRVGPVTAGFKLGRETENEDRHSDDFFSIAHSQDRWIGQLGALTGLMGWSLGAQWEFGRGDVLGKSEDAARYHEDNFTWSCPENVYSFSAIRPLAGGRVEGGFRGSFMDREGSENVVISWSDDSPLNGSGADFFRSAATFWESESIMEIGTRWRYHLRPGTVLGVEGLYRDWEHEVTEGINFKGSQGAGHWESTAYEIGAGLSQTLLDARLLAAVEARAGMADWRVDEDLSSRAADGRVLAVGVGLEYFATRAVVLRTGYQFGSNDTNVDAPLTLLTGQTIAAGLSWMPRGGLVQVHGGVLYSDWTPDDPAATEISGEDQTGYVLSLRLLL